MITRLSTAAVCVVDDEPSDYQPILDALLKLGIACVHVRGDLASPLPPKPFKGLRIVFTDLYLSGSIGKTAASHTANVFKNVVSADTAPVLVVIWSKHTDERNVDSELPPEDQPTAAELFKSAVLEAEPLFRDRLIFTEMPKPKPGDRPEDSAWIATLQQDIRGKLTEFPAFDLLWSLESIVRDAAILISDELTELALHSGLPLKADGKEYTSLNDKLQVVFRMLAKEQGGPDCSETSAAKHLTTLLAQSLADRLEHSEGLETLSTHGAWLCKHDGLPDPSPFAARLNGILLTANVSTDGHPFTPGTVYRLNNSEKFNDSFGISSVEFGSMCCKSLKRGCKWKPSNWQSRVHHIFVEVSPACDFHQRTRCQALLVAGLLIPAEGWKDVKQGKAVETLPIFNLRWPIGGNVESDVFLMFCSRYKLTLTSDREPGWLTPWFRLRELPTAALRNWHSSHASRVGYVSFR